MNLCYHLWIPSTFWSVRGMQTPPPNQGNTDEISRNFLCVTYYSVSVWLTPSLQVIIQYFRFISAGKPWYSTSRNMNFSLWHVACFVIRGFSLVFSAQKFRRSNSQHVRNPLQLVSLSDMMIHGQIMAVLSKYPSLTYFHFLHISLYHLHSEKASGFISQAKQGMRRKHELNLQRA